MALARLRGRETEAEFISDPAVFAGLREEWTELLRDSDSDGLFLTWEWMHTWWRFLGKGRRLLLITIRAEGRLVAIAPFALRRAAIWRSPPLRYLEMLGSGTAGSDHLDVIVRRGWGHEVALSLAARLTSAGHMLGLKRIRCGSSAMHELVAGLQAGGWRAQETPGEVCPYIPRPPAGFTGYLASLGGEHRYAFKRKLQSFQKRFAAKFESAATEPQRREFLAILIELHEKRWQGRGHSEAFDSAGLREFHEAFSALALERGWLRLFVLRADEKPVAALYGFRYGAIFSFYQSGFDPVWGKQSVGMVTMGLSIESAFTEGASEFDMLHGDEPYKFHWARAVHQLSNLELFPPGARGLMFQGLAALVKSARRAGRKLLRPASAEGARAEAP